MIVTIFDREDERNKVNGLSTDRWSLLVQILESMLRRKPFCCELRGENGYDLMIGIGSLGHAQYSRADGDPPYLMALANKPSARRSVEFLLGGTATPIKARFCMPFEEIIDIARYFQETGERSPKVNWEEV